MIIKGDNCNKKDKELANQNKGKHFAEFFALSVIKYDFKNSKERKVEKAKEFGFSAECAECFGLTARCVDHYCAYWCSCYSLNLNDSLVDQIGCEKCVIRRCSSETKKCTGFSLPKRWELKSVKR